jgi:hypothetical protein
MPSRRAQVRSASDFLNFTTVLATVINRYGVVFWRPGDHFDYSNIGYGVLDRVVSDVATESYRISCKRIFSCRSACASARWTKLRKSLRITEWITNPCPRTKRLRKAHPRLPAALIR